MDIKWDLEKKNTKKERIKKNVIYTPSLFAVVDSTVNIEWCRYDGLKSEISEDRKSSALLAK